MKSFSIGSGAFEKLYKVMVVFVVVCDSESKCICVFLNVYFCFFHIRLSVSMS